MRSPLLLATAVLAPPLLAQAGQSAPIDTALARQYFQEAHAAAARDGGRLWGIPLDGTLMFAEPKGRTVVAERGDTAGLLTRTGAVWTGTMPRNRNVANTAQEWGGVLWTTVVWPPPAGSDAEARALRAELFGHELWHAIQERIGLPGADPPNPHLDKADARTWLRLEGRALSAALASTGAARRRAIEDALRFRALRHERFPGAAESERALERHEGLASYTGIRVSGRDSAGMIGRARQKLDELDAAEHHARSFAYATGPALGLLLDGAVPDWRMRLGAGKGPADLLVEAYPVRAADAEGRGGAYGLGAVRAAEQEREARREARLAQLSAALLEGPVIELPFGQVQLQIDPNGAEPLRDAGTVYVTLRVSDRWGVLDVKGGTALVAGNFSSVRIPRPDGAQEGSSGPLRGDGWTLTLAEGYTLSAGARAGDLTAVRR